jgi:hypothetical protein
MHRGWRSFVASFWRYRWTGTSEPKSCERLCAKVLFTPQERVDAGGIPTVSANTRWQDVETISFTSMLFAATHPTQLHNSDVLQKPKQPT